jgi:hypothetical protein
LLPNLNMGLSQNRCQTPLPHHTTHERYPIPSLRSLRSLRLNPSLFPFPCVPCIPWLKSSRPMRSFPSHGGVPRRGGVVIPLPWRGAPQGQGGHSRSQAHYLRNAFMRLWRTCPQSSALRLFPTLFLLRRLCLLCLISFTILPLHHPIHPAHHDRRRPSAQRPLFPFFAILAFLTVKSLSYSLSVCSVYSGASG